MRAICLLIFFGMQIAFAQPYKSTHYTTKNGLSSNNVIRVLKDKDGFVWVATGNGLNRFDGNRFVVFQKDYNDSNSIGQNFITDLCQDVDKNLYFNFSVGFAMWQPLTHRFKNFYLKRYVKDLDGILIVLHPLGNQKVVAVTTRGIYLFDVGRYTCINLRFPPQAWLPVGSIETSVRDTGSSYWVIASRKLYHWDMATNRCDSLPSEMLRGANGLFLTNDEPHHRLIASTYNKGLLIYDQDKKTWRQASTPQAVSTDVGYDPVYSLQPFANNKFLYTTELNVGWFDGSTHGFQKILPDPLFEQSVVRNAIMDDKDNIWVATSNGLVRASQETLALYPIKKISGSQGAFATVQAPAGTSNIFTSNYDYPFIYKVDATTMTYKRLPTTAGFVPGVLRYVFIDKQQNTWLSTENEVYLLKNKTTTWKRITFDTGRRLQPRNFVQDAYGTVWLRVRNSGLYRYEAKRSCFMPSVFTASVSTKEYAGMVTMQQGREIWASETRTGLYRMDPPRPVPLLDHLNDEMDQKSFERIASHDDSLIWIGDNFNGIFRYNTRSHIKKHFTTSDGLLTNYNETIAFDNRGNVWTFSGEGISRIDGTNGRVTNFQHPLLTRIQNIATSTDGRLYVAADKAIYWFCTDSLPTATNRNRLYRDHATINNEPVAWPAPLAFDHVHNDITLYFGVMNEGDEAPYNVQYRFVGDTVWNDLNDRGSLSFFKMAPGNYELVIRLQSDADSNQWLNAGWTIHKPFWQALWFRVAASIIIVLGVFLFVRKRIDSIRQKALLQQRTAKAETMALRAQMNPHFIFNCISSIDNFILDNEKEKASNYLNKFAKLIRSILDSSKSNVVPFWKDWEALRLYLELEHLRSDHNFNFSIHAEEALLSGHYKIPALIIQPYVENAIHHGLLNKSNGERELSIIAKLDNNILTYIIEDNGIGRAKADALNHANRLQHNSYGMQMSQERISLFNQQSTASIHILDLEYTSGHPCGTRVTIHLQV